MQIVEVFWRDSRIYFDQLPLNDPFVYATMTTVGYLVSEDDEQVVICRDLVDSDGRGIIVIPKENIVSLVKKK